MSDQNIHPAERIEALELAIEEMREKIALSRRLMTAGGFAALAGPVLLVALMFGLVAFSPARVLAGLAMLIGGIVLLGSSKASTEELQRKLGRAEATRNAAIDALGLVPAEGETAPGTALPRPFSG